MHPKEVVHLSFGTSANHVATHFWNTQEAYMEYGASQNGPLVDHDVSFREGVGIHGESTYTPRALFFDVRQEYGTLRERNALYGAEEDDQAIEDWGSEVIHTSETVEPSWYSEQLRDEDQGVVKDAIQGREIQYWSDYARCMIHPKSIVPVSAPSLHGTSFLKSGSHEFRTYEQGYAVAQAMERDQARLENNIRWVAEESDLMQGFQVTANASDAFSGVHGFYLAGLSDEYPKTERVVFNLADSIYPSSTEASGRPQKLNAMNRVLSMIATLEYASLQVPLAAKGVTNEHVQCTEKIYETSAVLATFMESATLPTRLKDRENWSRIVAQLNWRKDTKIAQLGGVFPTPLLAEIRAEKQSADALIEAMFAAKNIPMHTHDSKPFIESDKIQQLWRDVSTSYADGFLDVIDDVHVGQPQPTSRSLPYAEALTARDADPFAEIPTLAAIQKWNPAQEPLFHKTFTRLAFPLQSAYPSYFTGLTSDGRPLPIGAQAPPKVKSIPVVASMKTTPDTLAILRDAKALVNHVVSRREPLEAYGVSSAGRSPLNDSEGAVGGLDGLREIRETLESACAAYGMEEDTAEEPGTDEEWQNDDDDRWDI
ncbi:mtDNA inheritance, partitioning of the mitochondrial organelle [Malassezia yamatoensis]|uniref:MtDNA inheritance, partitioning of the mitochondrial organelle n=1 Tax=Malassezia yamatoensis TaxID=253288 RepID=A0AAJ5YX83_9BASI|nr:mtDNA inheritance, partitioning of the mitochondrial organelle [Malassezia yamatoensis]